MRGVLSVSCRSLPTRGVPHAVRTCSDEGNHRCKQQRTPAPMRMQGAPEKRLQADLGLRAMENILAATVGGLLALGGVYFARRSERRHWRRELQVRIASEALTALQGLVREITSVAYLEDVPKRHKMGRFVDEHDIEKGSGDVIPDVSATPPDFFAAVTSWNSAVHQILVAGTPALAQHVRSIDEEVDRLLDSALYQQWTRQGFRRERAPLGRMMAEFVDTVRNSVGLKPLSMTSVWTWDGWETTGSVDPAEEYGSDDATRLL